MVESVNPTLAARAIALDYKGAVSKSENLI
jgi:hypothetical protein